MGGFARGTTDGVGGEASCVDGFISGGEGTVKVLVETGFGDCTGGVIVAAAAGRFFLDGRLLYVSRGARTSVFR